MPGRQDYVPEHEVRDRRSPLPLQDHPCDEDHEEEEQDVKTETEAAAVRKNRKEKLETPKRKRTA